MAPPFREHEFDIRYGTGISKEGDVADIATDLGIIDKNGAWYSYRGERIGLGREQACDTLRGNAAMCDEIEERIRLHFGLIPDATGKKAVVDASKTAKAHVKSEATGGGNGSIQAQA
jgi:recombination protein RecA